MLNIEKYKDEFMKLMQDCNTEICRKVNIIKKYPIFYDKLQETCRDYRSQYENEFCVNCTKRFVDWLLKESEEPDIDWESIPVDTVVEVSDNQNTWEKRYFAEYRDGVYCFRDGTTSKTTVDPANIKKWKYYRLLAKAADNKPQFSLDTLPQGAGFHNSIYHGKNLGDKVTEEQYNSIENGSFDNLFIGDYWEIDDVTWRIAAFDYYLATALSTCATHHVVIVPDECLYDLSMNSKNVIKGGYIGSEMYMTGLDEAESIIKKAFGDNHILEHDQWFSSEIETGFVVDVRRVKSNVHLMNEVNVYGHKVFSNCLQGTNWAYNHTIDNTQFPLFRHNPVMINPYKQYYWLRDVASEFQFVTVCDTGFADTHLASNFSGVRPTFCICK